MSAYYNEIEPYAAQWLRNLIKEGLIADGEVDTRSIVYVQPVDLRGFTQCHFFAGIGGWSHALRLAGWPDDRPVWTGSCPCQPFSVAGKGAGVDDARHLWPHFHRLITACRPPVVMGEQVAGKAGYGWFDGVRADLEGTGYSSRAVDIPALAVNAPHIRQRLYWIAMDLAYAGHMRRGNRPKSGEQELPPPSGLGSPTVAMVYPTSEGLERHGQSGRVAEGGVRETGVVFSGEGCGFVHMADLHQGRQLEPIDAGERPKGVGSPQPSRDSGSDHMADTQSIGREEQQRQDWQQDAGSGSQGRVDVAGTDKGDVAHPDQGKRGRRPCDGDGERDGQAGGRVEDHRQLAGGGEDRLDVADAKHFGFNGGTVKGSMGTSAEKGRMFQSKGLRSAPSFWDDHIWLTGSDGKSRRVEPSISLLAHGVSNRVGRLRAYGNAIVPPLAAEVIKAFMETEA